MRFSLQILTLALCGTVCVSLARAQSFSSGSTGSDGAYSPTVSGNFDPVALGLDSSGDNVFNFTTINIPAGVTIRLGASKLRNAAVTWLATGNVTIAGTLDLTGMPGPALNTGPTMLYSSRVLPEPGAGGYTGGLGSLGGNGPQAGAGPGGGGAGAFINNDNCYGGDAAYIGGAYSTYNPGRPYGSYLLVPLYGGSGGGGGWDNQTATNVGGIGGAGGGAIRIASTTQISVTGTINASGGNDGTVTGSGYGCVGGAGSGGAIHLVAPTITGSGTLKASSGYDRYNGYANNGIIRFSTTTNSFTGSAAPGLILSPVYLPPANSTLALPLLTITQVNGVAVPVGAAGSYFSPDVTINAPGAVTVNLVAANIPLGTVVTLRITAEGSGADAVISCTPLAGAVTASTATCSATFPFSISIADVNASW